MIEARLKGMKPLAVNGREDTVEKAVEEAVNKLTSLLDTTLGRLRKY